MGSVDGRRTDPTGGQFRLDGRPTAQWSRIRAGRDDDLGTTPDGGHSEQPLVMP